MGGNCVWHAESAWMVLKVVHWGYNECVKVFLGWCRVNSLTVLGFDLLGFFIISCASEDSYSLMGGSDIVRCVQVSLTGTTVAPFWANWSVVWDWFVQLNSFCTLLTRMGAPLMLFCNGPTLWQCSQGYVVPSTMIM